MDETQFSYPLELGVSMFSGRHALKVNAYQELYMQAVEPHLKNIGMDEAKLMETRPFLREERCAGEAVFAEALRRLSLPVVAHRLSVNLLEDALCVVGVFKAALTGYGCDVQLARAKL